MNRTRPNRRPAPTRSALVAGFAVSLIGFAGCAAGPDYAAPAAPEVSRFTLQALPAQTAGGAHDADRPQRFVATTAVPLQWWTELGSADIDRLVASALAHSPTLVGAQAALVQAQELTAAQRAAFFPSVQASYAPLRARVPDVTASPLNSGAPQYTLHTAQLSISYAADVFGANQRAVESLQAQGESARWQLLAVRLTLAANVVNAVLGHAALQEQLASTERLGAIAAQQLTLLQAQRRLGAAPGAAVLAQEALRWQADAASAALRKQLALQHDLLAVLTGVYPADLVAPTLTLGQLRLPDVPVLLPALLVAQRPDVRAAEAQLHAANAQVGVAAANTLPQLSLGASFGASAQALGQLFSAGGLLWSVGANLVQPVFDTGALQHRKRAAQAQVDQALAQYQNTLLTAFQNVADALEAVRHDADVHVATQHQQAAAQASLRIAQRQLDRGDISVLTLLNSESIWLQATLAQTQAQASRYSDAVAVYQSLGGGWEFRSEEGSAPRQAPAVRGDGV